MVSFQPINARVMGQTRENRAACAPSTGMEKSMADMDGENGGDLTCFRQFELKFSCAICWNAKLRMVYGSCQHRLCEDCLYDSEGKRKAGLQRCPSCQKLNSFPEFRPDVPEDNVEIQVYLGVRKCPNSGCGLEMWHWELCGHLASCKFGAKQRKGKTSILCPQDKSDSNQNTHTSSAVSGNTPWLRKKRASSMRKKRKTSSTRDSDEHWLRSGKRRRLTCN